MTGDINLDLLSKYNAIQEYVLQKIHDDGLVETAEKYKKIFEEKLNVINEEYRSIDKNSYQSRIQYQKYILLLHSRLYNIGPIYKLVPEYNQDWLVKMMCDCHFVYICYCLEKLSLVREDYSSQYEDCLKILSR